MATHDPHPGPTSSPVAPAPGRSQGSTRGAKVLVASGAVVLLLALVVGGFAARVFVRTLPFEVLSADGGAGSGVVGVVPVPGEESLTLDEGSYAVYLAHPARGPEPDTSRFADHVTVTGPDGEPVRLSGPSASGTVGMGGTSARTVTGFSVPTTGDHVVEVDASLGEEVRLLLVEDAGFVAFFGGVMGTVMGVFAALGLGAVGLGLGVGGGILWYRRTH